MFLFSLSSIFHVLSSFFHSFALYSFLSPLAFYLPLLKIVSFLRRKKDKVRNRERRDKENQGEREVIKKKIRDRKRLRVKKSETENE